MTQRTSRRATGPLPRSQPRYRCHRASAPPSSARAPPGRSGLVVAVSSGLVASVGLPGQRRGPDEPRGGRHHRVHPPARLADHSSAGADATRHPRRSPRPPVRGWPSSTTPSGGRGGAREAHVVAGDASRDISRSRGRSRRAAYRAGRGEGPAAAKAAAAAGRARPARSATGALGQPSTSTALGLLLGEGELVDHGAWLQVIAIASRYLACRTSTGARRRAASTARG